YFILSLFSTLTPPSALYTLSLHDALPIFGVHPTYAKEAGDDVITPLRELAKSPRVVAIGETGLDYHSLPSKATAKDKKVQVFAKDRKSTRLNSSHRTISYAVFCLKKKKQ